MKIGPFTAFEKRESSLTDTLVSVILNRAQGGAVEVASATAALEMCAGTVGRGFASAEATGRPGVVAALTPDLLEMVGRGLIRSGNAVFLIDTTMGGLKLLPVQSWDVDGDPDPDSWEYMLTLGGPSRTFTHNHVSAASVLHFRYAQDFARPWRGNSPTDIASLAGKLSAETASALASESSGPVGSILLTPRDADSDTMTAFKGDLGKANGRLMLLESGDWGDSGAAPMDATARRFGAMPPAPLVDLMDTATREIVSAVGFNPSLFQTGPAAAIREAWRLALFGVISPLGRKVAAELSAKLGPVEIGWGELKASDLSGRARSFQSMVGGGMSVEDAAMNADLVMEHPPTPDELDGEKDKEAGL